MTERYTHLTRIQYLGMHHPDRVELDEEGRQVLVVGNGEKVGDVMWLVKNLTWEWAIDNKGSVTKANGDPVYQGSKHAGGSLPAHPDFLKDYKLPVGME